MADKPNAESYCVKHAVAHPIVSEALAGVSETAPAPNASGDPQFRCASLAGNSV